MSRRVLYDTNVLLDVILAEGDLTAVAEVFDQRVRSNRRFG